MREKRRFVLLASLLSDDNQRHAVGSPFSKRTATPSFTRAMSE